MSDDEFDRIARRWLEDGPTSMRTDALRAALDTIHVTSQRRAWWPAGRARIVGSTIRYLAVAVAVVIATVIGLNLRPAASGIGVGAGPTQTIAPTPTPIPLPGGEVLQTLSQPGATYSIGAPFPIAITFSAPASWLGNIGGPYAAYLNAPSPYGSEGPDVAFTLSQQLYANPCAGTSYLNPQPGPTVDDLATALARLPGINATTATDVTIDGIPGKQLTLTASSQQPGGCMASSGGADLWQLPLGAVFSLAPGQSMVVRILDVGGQRLVISSDTFAGSTAADLAALQRVLDSIHFVNPR